MVELSWFGLSLFVSFLFGECGPLGRLKHGQSDSRSDVAVHGPPVVVDLI